MERFTTNGRKKAHQNSDQPTHSRDRLPPQMAFNREKIVDLKEMYLNGALVA